MNSNDMWGLKEKLDMEREFLESLPQCDECGRYSNDLALKTYGDVIMACRKCRGYFRCLKCGDIHPKDFKC